MASQRVYYNEMREDDLDFIDPNENILWDELDCEKKLKSLKYDWTQDRYSLIVGFSCKL